MEKIFNEVLVKMYGEQTINDIELIKEKISIVITAHLFAGNQGDNPLCKINRLFEKIKKS